MFFDDFETLLELIIPIPEQILIIRDFNWHVDDINDSAACRFLGLLEVAGLHKHVDKPTYDSNHTLDLVISRQNSDIVSNVNVVGGLPSFHDAVTCLLNFQPPKLSKKTLTYRKTRAREIDIENLMSDIEESALCKKHATYLIDLVDQLNSVLHELLNIHAPVVTKTVTVCSQAP